MSSVHCTRGATGQIDIGEGAAWAVAGKFWKGVYIARGATLVAFCTVVCSLLPDWYGATRGLSHFGWIGRRTKMADVRRECDWVNG